MRITTTISVVLMALVTLSWVPQTTDKIKWTPETQLTWDNFMGSSEEQTEYAAYTYAELSYSVHSDGEGTVVAYVTCNFIPSKSWKDTKKNLTPAILKHEQGHFDIAEINARRLRKLFKEYIRKNPKSKSLGKDMTTMFHAAIEKMNVDNNRYDSETVHSINEEKQQQWNTKIEAQLEELKEFEG